MEALTTAAVTESRMQKLWKAWQDHRGERTLVFCCSIRHAAFTEEWLTARGVRCKTVTGETPSLERSRALADLASGHLDALCSVDLFNEGVDLPSVDRVVMLRPTESRVLFLQQLGRGLRRNAGKASLTVIDFVGNHKVFLGRVRLLLSFALRPVPIGDFLEARAMPELPTGCSIDLELEAIDMLRFLIPRGESEVIRAYREVRELRGERPAAGELFRMGYLVSRLNGWFSFVEKEGDLSEEEKQVRREAEEWFEDLERTPMSKCFKMILLEALLERDALTSGMAVDELARKCHALLVRSPEFFRDIENVARLEDPRRPDPATWLAYWRENPVRAWTEGPQSRWFKLEGDHFFPRFAVPDARLETFARMTRELVDYRLAQYRRRSQDGGGAHHAFSCKLLSNQRDPILKLPRRTDPAVPEGEVDVRLPDGAVWRFRFMKEYCNVARPAGKDRNELPDLLRSWFGPSAGKPGTNFHVRFAPAPDGLRVEPESTVVASFPSRTRVRAFHSLRAAAGAARADSYGSEGSGDSLEEVTLPITRPSDRLFAVRAAGSSMDGGKDPIRDGDWVVLRWARGEALKNLAGKIALVETADPDSPAAYQLKRIVRETGKRWLLRSDNPDVPDFDTTEQTVPIALLVETFKPEELAPPVGRILEAEELAGAFGLSEQPATGRTEGHLFIFVSERGSFVAPDRLDQPVRRNPGETAFVLARMADSLAWRYCGVGRWLEAESLWAIPELDGPTWNLLGQGGQGSSPSVSSM